MNPESRAARMRESASNHIMARGENMEPLRGPVVEGLLLAIAEEIESLRQELLFTTEPRA